MSSIPTTAGSGSADSIAIVAASRDGPHDQVVSCEQQGLLTLTWCFAMARQSFAMVRRAQMHDVEDDQDITLRRLARRGFCLQAFEGTSRAEVLQRLRTGSETGESIATLLTERWLSSQEPRIRRQLRAKFLELGKSLFLDQASREMNLHLSQLVEDSSAV